MRLTHALGTSVSPCRHGLTWSGVTPADTALWPVNGRTMPPLSPVDCTLDLS